MGSSLSPDSLLEVSPIPCFCHVIGEKVNKLSLLLDSPLTVFLHCWIATWVGCLCVGALAMLRAIRCSIGWALTAAASVHGMQWAMWHCHNVITYSNLRPNFRPFTPKEKKYFCCCSGPDWFLGGWLVLLAGNAWWNICIFQVIPHLWPVVWVLQGPIWHFKSKVAECIVGN